MATASCRRILPFGRAVGLGFGRAVGLGFGLAVGPGFEPFFLIDFKGRKGRILWQLPVGVGTALWACRRIGVLATP